MVHLGLVGFRAEVGGIVFVIYCPEQGIKLLGLLLTGSTGQRTASRNGLA